jgi:nucleotide-binding universal stress UspA family protein
MLVTLDVPLVPSAVEFAVDSAVESGSPLLVVNVVATAFLPATLAGWDYVVRPEIEDSLRRPCELAPSLGVRVERLRVRSPHPIAALLELVAERRPGLLVFGPDPALTSRRVYRKAQRALQKQEHCLVWVAAEW